MDLLQIATVQHTIKLLKGAMSPHTHARANENKLEKVGPSFSSSVGDFICLNLSHRSIVSEVLY